MADEDQVTLLSSDGDEFKVSREVAEQSEAIRNILADTSDDSVVPLMNVRSQILQKVIQYCEFSVEHAKQDAAGKTSKTVDEVRPGLVLRRANRVSSQCVLVLRMLSLELVPRTGPTFAGEKLQQGVCECGQRATLRAHPGCKLPQHQALAGHNLSGGRRTNQGEDT
jgi:Skp1 family, tetramerisation domain